ncbi:MAG: exodeoxyribonuclease VII small subunit [Candidatus Saccharimonadales bacterium]
MTKSDLNNLTIQEKIAKLDEFVEWFESDDFQLEQASSKLKEAAALTADIEHNLEAVANDIRQVKQSFANESN